MSATQTARVLRALQAHPEGIHQGQFIQTPAIDGEHRLTRLAARIQDLKDAGYRIEVVGKRHRYAIYRLVTDLGAAADTGVTAPAAPSGGPATPPRATHTKCDACGHRTTQTDWFPEPCPCGAPVHWVGTYESELAARRHQPFRRVQTRQAA